MRNPAFGPGQGSDPGRWYDESDEHEEGLSRPWCCPEPRCAPVHQLSDNPVLSVASPGDSFTCWGSLGSVVAFSYDGVEHANDLRSCHFTPLKGLIMWQENVEDWWLLRQGYAAALQALGAHRSDDMGESSGG